MVKDKQDIIAVIPARGGSKGVAKKNIRPLAGKPLITYTIEAAKKSKLKHIFVSTDSEEIVAVCQQAGLEVPFLRPEELAQDDSPTSLALQHAVKWYEEKYQRGVFAVVTLQPTTPLRTAEDINNALEHFLNNVDQADSLITVLPASHMHPLTLYHQSGQYLKPFIIGENPTTRRQEFSQVYWRFGAIYVTRRDLLFKNRVVSDKPLFFELKRSQNISIDDCFDFELAELYLQYQDKLERAEGENNDEYPLA